MLLLLRYLCLVVAGQAIAVMHAYASLAEQQWAVCVSI